MKPTRISSTFKRLRTTGKKAFIPYIMAGDPSLIKTKEIVLLFEECGADIVELGVPFSDPLADGPTIQRAAERALKNAVTLKKVISLVKELRSSTGIPLVLMTYFNPVYRYGIEQFIKDARGAGVDGVIVPDLPPEEAGDFMRLARQAGIDTIFLLAPTSTEERIQKVTKASRGFIYYVSITGITGASLSIDSSMQDLIARIKHVTDKPVAVGFGVSSPEEASALASMSDGVIIGSSIVKKAYETPDELRSFLMALRKAIS